MLQLPLTRPPRNDDTTRARPRRAGTALLAAGLASLACAGPAAAAGIELYGVEVDAIVETSYSGESHSTEFEHDASLATSTHVTAGFLASIDRAAGGRIIGATGEDQHTATTTGTITTREREFDDNADDWWERATECRGAGQNKNDEGRTSLRADPLTPLVGASLILNLADELLVDVTCTDTGPNGGAGPRSFTLNSPIPEDELSGVNGPLAVSFDLPEEATRAGKVIQLFEGPAEGQAAYCPETLAEQPYLKRCTVRFRGTITLEKVSLDQPQPPVTPPPVTPPPVAVPPAPAPPTTAPERSQPSATVPAKQRARLDAKGARLTFRAACPAGCTGSATIRVPGARPKKPRTLAAIRLQLPRAAQARTVALTVPKRARKQLLRSRGAVIVVALKDRVSGRTTTTTLKVTR
ncbi:hypothetical protein VSS74_20920 [Conexibacter stalactiti]|uniref:Uncharacterized protein n=1 Tax=Conexibacter stalactiti TaxID=1940611 RepID=A0ABU4HU28_9ACTN|nr:hypothetical protein [Conexibacter stalactiti]MDW5596822.1 hypothetical protein [Conexibacter stalactiti]MEC5037464.1 hypothetical protein [Conexibacter stalactiti]